MQNVLPRSRSAILILSAGIALFILNRALSLMIQFHSQSALLQRSLLDRTAYLSDDGIAIGVGADVETLAALAQAVAAKDRKTL
jgi:hypothetical protein